MYYLTCIRLHVGRKGFDCDFSNACLTSISLFCILITSVLYHILSVVLDSR